MPDFTHDAALRSWVESANDPATDFPIQNLPFGVFKAAGRGEARIGVAIGEQIADVRAMLDAGALGSVADATRDALREPALNALMALGRAPLRALRHALTRALQLGANAERAWLVSRGEAELLLPARIGDYTDFYASLHHATNVGSMFRPDNPLLPNYKWVPIGYHGRASSIIASGTPVRRPIGQTRNNPEHAPTVGPSARLDYELEMGVFIGAGNRLGEPIAIDTAAEHIFGLCLVNDWSARDVQTWEYQPLGPFLAKNFATSISPWVVTLDALEPYRAAAFERAAEDPEPLAYLASSADAASGGIDVTLDVSIITERMRAAGLDPFRVSIGSFTQMYWTIAQLVAHHAVNGCNLTPGDLLASGTVSGPTKESRGCLLERTWRGTEPLTLPTGETRTFLQDGDEVVMRGWCERAGRARIGFGEVRGRILPARSA